MTNGRIVVGVDGSCEHLTPIEWAYREAGRREAALDLVHAWNLPLEISPSPAPLELDPGTLDPRRSIVSTSDRGDRPGHPRIGRGCELHDPLCEREPSAPPGQRRRRPAGCGPARARCGPRPTGSVSHQCIHHARCPVAVIPNNWPSALVPERSLSASTAAADRPAHCAGRWTKPLGGMSPSPSCTPGTRPIRSSLGESSRPPRTVSSSSRTPGSLRQDAAAAEADGASRPPKVEPMTIEEAAGPALVDASADAGLLVVGSRGRGGSRSPTRLDQSALRPPRGMPGGGRPVGGDLSSATTQLPLVNGTFGPAVAYATALNHG